MRRLDPAATLLEKARADLIALQENAANQRFADEIWGFLCQQTLEKSLKAVLLSRRISFRKTHDLEELHDLLIAEGLDVPGEYRRLYKFTMFAVHYRYDQWIPEMEHLDRPALLVQVRECLAWAEGELTKASK